MPSPKHIFLFSCLLILTNCKSQITFPKNLDEAVIYFQQNWSKEQLAIFKNKSENEAVTDEHFATGIWIRNNWIRSNKDTTFKNHFNELGIYAPDDISSIVLTSLHRTLNKKDVELGKQVEFYKSYWQAIIDCNEKQKIQALSNYNKLKVGDSITIYMLIDTSDGNSNAVIQGCPTPEWIFDKDKDLIIKGIIKKKYFINDTSNVFFSIQVNHLNRKDIEILTNNVKVGDRKDFSLIGLTIQ